MSFQNFVYLPTAALTLAGLLIASGGSASAHEQRTVGDYALEVGFNVEPALVNQLNGVFLNVQFFEAGVPEASEGEEVEGGEPVEGLDESLKVEVVVGGGAAKKELNFAAVEAEPGSYVAAFLPTVTGDYTFRIFGEIEGTAIDESFESGPGRFDSVESLDELAFPEAPADNASLAQSVQELQTKVDSLDSIGSSSDSTARTMGVIAIVAGLAGLGAGGFGAMKRRG